MKSLVYFLFCFILVGEVWAQAYEQVLLIRHEPWLQEKVLSLAEPVRISNRIHIYRLKIPYAKLNLEDQRLFQLLPSGEVAQYQPLQLKKIEPIPAIVEHLQKISLDQYNLVLQSIVFSGKRNSASLNEAAQMGNEKTQNFLLQKFKEFGFEASTNCFRRWLYADECNVVGIKRGSVKPDEYVIVEGHFDAVATLNAGADDNATGAAGVLELARVLKDIDLNRSIIFLGTNGEERGLMGSRAYVKELEGQRLLEKVQFVLNMDMIGYNRDGIFNIETNKQYKELAEWVALQAQTYSKLKPNISMPAWGSDHVPFLDKFIPAVLTIESWADHTPCYHQSCDTIETLNMNYIAEMLKINLAIILQKAEMSILGASCFATSPRPE